MDQHDKVCQLFVAEDLFNDPLEVDVLLDTVSVNVFVNPT